MTSSCCERYRRPTFNSVPLLQLDACRSDHLGPFVGIFDNVFAEFVWRICRYCIAEFGDPLLQRRSGEAGVDLRLTEAKKALARLQELDPAASIANFQERAPLRRREDPERLESGLRRAGMPEN